MMGRLTTGLVILSLFHPLAAHATTAPSLSARIHIDGVLDEYASDEWVLDATSTLAEKPDDSAWGSDDEITRVALTWDENFLYLAVEGRTFESFLALFLSNRAGGLRTLEDAGDFRRAIELPGLPINLFALAGPMRVPEIARADDAHPFALVDGVALRRAVSGVRGGVVGFEMAVPWSVLSLAAPVKLVAVVTGDAGSGAGDAAPNTSSTLDDDGFALTVLDRWFEIDADVDDNGAADYGVSPRTAGHVERDPLSTLARTEASVRFDVYRRAFAPDRGEHPEISFEVESGSIYVNFFVYSLEGDRLKWLNQDFPDHQISGGLSVPVPWDGTDASGTIVRGGTYIFVADWGYQRGEHAGRAKAAVVVVR